MKKIGRALLFPHIAVMIILLPISAVFLICAMIYKSSDSAVSIASYALAFYTLMIWCFRIPQIIRIIKTFRKKNKYAQRWREDPRLRVRITLYGSLIWNTVYAVFQMALGFYHSSFWYFSLAGYYLSLAVMRFYLARYTHRHRAGENMREELIKYRTCGIAFLIMNLAVSLMIFFMVYWNRTFHHHEITAIAMAAYTFISLFLAIRNISRYRRYNSPVYSASRAVSLAAACVSLLTLESTLLTTFDGSAASPAFRRIMLSASGGAISAFIIAMAVYMIANSTKRSRQFHIKEKDNG